MKKNNAMALMGHHTYVSYLIFAPRIEESKVKLKPNHWFFHPCIIYPHLFIVDVKHA